MGTPTIETRLDTMPPKKNVREPAPSAAATTQAGTSTVGSVPPTPKPSKTSAPSTINATNWDKVVLNIYDHYLTHTPQRTKLLDVFLGFLVVVGALQFLYCILAGNYPFNAFLSGFCRLRCVQPSSTLLHCQLHQLRHSEKGSFWRSIAGNLQFSPVRHIGSGARKRASRLGGWKIDLAFVTN